MPIHPVGTGVGRVVFGPIFDESPEGLGVFFILGGDVGPDQGVDESKAIGFPDVFDVNMSWGDCFVGLRPPRNDM